MNVSDVAAESLSIRFKVSDGLESTSFAFFLLHRNVKGNVMTKRTLELRVLISSIMNLFLHIQRNLNQG